MDMMNFCFIPMGWTPLLPSTTPVVGLRLILSTTLAVQLSSKAPISTQGAPNVIVYSFTILF